MSEAEKLALAKEIAATILAGFNKHFRIFREISQRARLHFIHADWKAGRADARARINLYDQRVIEAMDTLRATYSVETVDIELWTEVKLQYMGMLYSHKQPELAETFYNSVFVRLFARHYYHNDNIFVRPSISTRRIDGEVPTYRSYYPTQNGWRPSIREILTGADVGLPFEDLRRDMRNLIHRMREMQLPRLRLHQHFQIQVLNSLVYRNKAAYLVGRVVNGEQVIPFILPLVHGEPGTIYVDALVYEPDDVANLFSFARTYFMVDCEVPAAVVRFLRSILPSKSSADLYTSIGFHKQGKAEFYRDFLDHLRHSSDQLVTAPGIKGMVMLVFTLPSYPYVFKVIKDRFQPPKETSREDVIAKYRMVKEHDRVGRIADTWEFSHAAFPRERFTPGLLEELRREAASVLEEENGQVVIKHLFIERRLTPLNLFLDTATEQESGRALQEYGDAVTEIAAAGIFPGDLLFKNFGVTRHGRVIFYDYDEIVPISEINFREIPPPRYPEDEFAAEPWYTVAPNDVFPEEFSTFLMTSPVLRKAFNLRHAGLLRADHWRALQELAGNGVIPDVYPYRREIRFFPSRTTMSGQGGGESRLAAAAIKSVVGGSQQQ